MKTIINAKTFSDQFFRFGWKIWSNRYDYTIINSSDYSILLFATQLISTHKTCFQSFLASLTFNEFSTSGIFQTTKRQASSDYTNTTLLLFEIWKVF